MGLGRRILVAGGASQIGAAIAARLAGNGDAVTVFGRVAKPASASRVHFISGDASVADDLIRLAAEIRRGGQLDGLVVAIGALHTARLGETTDDAWDAVLEANLVAPFLVAKTCLPLLGDGASIVFIGSGAGQWPELDLGAYSIAKRMLERMVEVLAMEAALRDIRVNTVDPGELVNPMATRVAPPVRAIPPTPIPPLGRKGQPDDVAAAVEFFLSNAASFCTGASLTVDGGLRAALRAHRVRQ